MPKALIPLIGLAMTTAAVLLVPRAEAHVSMPAPIFPGATSAVEEAAVCARRRVCGPRGCAWRTVCRRAPVRMAPRMMW
jgi:hypothetical protein